MSRAKPSTFPKLLWDLLTGSSTPRPAPSQQPAPAATTPKPGAKPKPPRTKPAAPASKPAAAKPRIQTAESMQDRYDALVRLMKKNHRIRVRKWRTNTTGCAWQVKYEDGTLVQLIEAPYPRGPVSAAVFLHEVGHHAIGFYRYKPRCLEEYMAWQWALNAMRQHNINITPRVQKRIDDHLRYQLAKARRRGLKKIPVELTQYLTPNRPAA